eukprot:COSAG06_NODE_261_length_18907_cov_6.696353_10_plen_98_part_00
MNLLFPVSQRKPPPPIETLPRWARLSFSSTIRLAYLTEGTVPRRAGQSSALFAAAGGGGAMVIHLRGERAPHHYLCYPRPLRVESSAAGFACEERAT